MSRSKTELSVTERLIIQLVICSKSWQARIVHRVTKSKQPGAEVAKQK